MKILFLITLCYITYGDIAHRRISNYAILLILFIVAFSGVFIPADWFYEVGAYEYLWMIAVFFVFLVFYFLKMMGAADVKLAAVLSLAVGVKIFFEVWLLSCLFAVIYAMGARFFTVLNKQYSYGDGVKNMGGYRRFVPYGALLCISTILVLLLRSWQQ